MDAIANDEDEGITPVRGFESETAQLGKLSGARITPVRGFESEGIDRHDRSLSQYYPRKGV